jgi:hypothetical protein
MDGVIEEEADSERLLSLLLVEFDMQVRYRM